MTYATTPFTYDLPPKNFDFLLTTYDLRLTTYYYNIHHKIKYNEKNNIPVTIYIFSSYTSANCKRVGFFRQKIGHQLNMDRYRFFTFRILRLKIE